MLAVPLSHPCDNIMQAQYHGVISDSNQSNMLYNDTVPFLQAPKQKAPINSVSCPVNWSEIDSREKLSQLWKSQMLIHVHVPNNVPNSILIHRAKKYSPGFQLRGEMIF